MVRRFIFLAAIAALAYSAGLLVFISELPRPDERAPTGADGIVVFTGGGARLSSAMALFADGAGKRLLISGVNPSVTRPDLAEIWQGEPALFDCCVDLGLEAQSTEGNATELDAWTRAHNFRSLILVTSEFHMPRAMLEAEMRLPDVEITPYAVASGHLGANGKPATFNDWRRLAGEYLKYLVVRTKTLFN